MTEEYDWAKDAAMSYYAARKYQREALLRSGKAKPINEREQKLVDGETA